MAPSINTSYAVIALGDSETIQRHDIADKAAEHGAVITEAYSFEAGEAATNGDLTEVDAVVTALGRALATRADIWVPFPMQDLGREAHLRRLSLVLQRHGLNMLMGPHLEPCPAEGGFNEIDFALRAEVKAVDDLGNAALARAAAPTLGVEIEGQLLEALVHSITTADAPPENPAPPVTEVAEKFYSTGEVARFLGRTVKWVDWAMRAGVFTRADGTPIEPIRVGKNRRRRFSLPVLRDIARACYRQGFCGENELLDLLAVLARAEGE